MSQRDPAPGGSSAGEPAAREPAPDDTDEAASRAADADTDTMDNPDVPPARADDAHPPSAGDEEGDDPAGDERGVAGHDTDRPASDEPARDAPVADEDTPDGPPDTDTPGSAVAVRETPAPPERVVPATSAAGGDQAPPVRVTLAPPGWMRSVGTRPLALVGVLLLVAALAYRAWLMRAAYFVEDDFLFFGRAYASPLDWTYLTERHKGHLMPGAMLLVYVQTALAPYNWGVTAAVMLAVQGAAGAVFFRLLWVVFGPRPVLLLPLVVYLFAPLTLPVLAWWSAALNAVPFQLALAVALLGLVHYLRTSAPRHAWLAAGGVLLGMAFSVKAVMLPPLLLAVAVAFLVVPRPAASRLGRLVAPLRTALTTHPRFWFGMAVLFVGYLAVYLTREETVEGEGAGLPNPEVAWTTARTMLGETFPAGVVGGPLTWGPVTPSGGLAEPDPAMVVAAWAVIGVLVLLSLWYRRRAWRAWALLAGYAVVVDLVPTLIARGRYEGLVGYDPRYVADATLVFALCLALAFLPTLEERRRDAADASRRPTYRRAPARHRNSAALLAGALFLGAAGYSMHGYGDTLSGDRVRWYLDTVRASMALAPAEAGIIPRPVPEDIVLPWNGPRRLSSYVLPPLAGPGMAERIARPQPSNRPMVFNDAGFLVDAEPAPDVHYFGPPEDEMCVPFFDGQVMWTIESLGGPELVTGLGYTSETEVPVAVVVGDLWVETTLPPAPDGGAWYVPHDGAGTRLAVLIEDPGVCVHAVTYGTLVPVVEGDPWA